MVACHTYAVMMLSYCLLMSSFSPALALIIFDTKTSVDNTKNVIDPGDEATFPDSAALGVPWEHVVRYGVNNASAVYLGHGYVLTARHVTTNDTNHLINGVSYNRDTSFTPVSVTITGTPSDAVVDLSLQKIVGDPGLPVLEIASPTTADTSKAVVMVGWGKGKGTTIANEGWNWGDNTTYAFRWGTNATNASSSTMTYNVGGVPMNFKALTTSFNSTKGADEAAGTLGDSGSALFQQVGSTWMLTGVTVSVSTNGSSRYAPIPDLTYFVRLREYSWVFRFDHWKAHYNILLTTADDDDSDEDGVPLLVEYALGMDPTIASTEGLPVASHDSGQLELTYTRLATTTDIAVEIETSPSLDSGSWSVEAATTTPLDTSTVVHSLKSVIPLGSETSKFARIRVTKL